jgi:glutathione peroxidase-family protein
MCQVLQFGGQAPGTSEEERDAALRKFGIEFDVMDKLDVNGDNAHPLYKFLRKQQPVSVPRTKRTAPGSSAVEWCACHCRHCLTNWAGHGRLSFGEAGDVYERCMLAFHSSHSGCLLLLFALRYTRNKSSVACRNYVKFLINASGQPVKRYGPSFDPLEFEGDLRLVLAGKEPTPEECFMHPGRTVCNVDRILAQ